MGHRKLTGAEFSQLHTSGIGFPSAQAEGSSGKTYDVLRDHTGVPEPPSDRIAKLREKYEREHWFKRGITIGDFDEMFADINELLDMLEAKDADRMAELREKYGSGKPVNVRREFLPGSREPVDIVDIAEHIQALADIDALVDMLEVEKRNFRIAIKAWDREVGELRAALKEKDKPVSDEPSRLAELREKYGAYSAISLIDPDGVNLVVEMGQVINELLDEIERLKRAEPYCSECGQEHSLREPCSSKPKMETFQQKCDRLGKGSGIDREYPVG